MKFQIDDWNMDKLPKGLNAKREDLTYLDYRTVPTLEEAKEHIWFKEWYDRGTNHREDKKENMIVCDVPFEEFTTEINSLEELLEIVSKGDDIVISKSRYLEAPLNISFGPCYD